MVEPACGAAIAAVYSGDVCANVVNVYPICHVLIACRHKSFGVQ